MDKEHRVSVYDMVKELNLKEVTPEINSKEVYIEQAEINRPALQLAGFFENFAQNRVQIIGKAEHLFIEEVEKDVENAKNIYKRFVGAGIPVIVSISTSVAWQSSFAPAVLFSCFYSMIHNPAPSPEQAGPDSLLHRPLSLWFCSSVLWQ